MTETGCVVVPEVDPVSMSYAGRVSLLTELERARARVDAVQQRTLALLAAEDRSVKQWVREEVACALRVSPAVAGARLASARELVECLPVTWARVQDATISMWQARVLVEETRCLDAGVRAAVEARVLVRAGEQTLPQFRASLRRAVARLDVRGEEQRQADALAGRRVVECRNDDGTAQIWALLPVTDSASIMDRVRRRARLLGLAEGHAPNSDPGADPGSESDPRTLDQRRADAFVDLLLGRPAPVIDPAIDPLCRTNEPDTAAGVDAPKRVPSDDGVLGDDRRPRRTTAPVVQVLVPLATLTGWSEGGAELAGYGPIGTDLARRVAADPDSIWQPVTVDERGRPIAVGHSYRPTAALRRLICARDRTCRFPGCRHRAETCEIDHVIAWDDGGPTVADNLHALCRRHHHLKHEAPGWHLDRDTEDTTTWTTPAGLTHTIHPDDTS